MTGLTPLADLYAVAADRKGGAAAFEATLTDPKPVDALAAIPDDRWLSEISKRVFQAGFNWSVVEAKWPAFEAVFDGFDVGRMALMSDDDLDRYLKADGIIRHAKKILSIRDNAAFLRALAAEHGSSAGAAIARWPRSDYVGLLALLKTRASRLGGVTGMYVLRFMGVDSFILSADVTRALVREGVIAKAASSKRDLSAVQAAFDHWADQSGRPFTDISRILACSVE